MNAMKNFEIAASAIYNEAPTDRAREFADKIANKIREKGEDWINNHITELHISDAEVSDDAIVSIEDNRLFYLTQWQIALAA